MSAQLELEAPARPVVPRPPFRLEGAPFDLTGRLARVVWLAAWEGYDVEPLLDWIEDGGRGPFPRLRLLD